MTVPRVRLLLVGLVIASLSVWPAAEANPASSQAVADPKVTFPAWYTYHRDAVRTGFSPSTPPLSKLSKAWGRRLDGKVFAEPLVWHGRVIAVTENDSVYSLSAGTGAVVWRTHLGTPVPLSKLPCGNIDPLGITSTPVYDPVTGRLFVLVERLNTRGRVQHRIFGLNPATGAVVGTRVVDPIGSDPTVEQQRGALALGNGRVYIVFGALSGDCGDYRGYVVAQHTSLARGLEVYSADKYLPGASGGGIWATSGPSVDGSGNVWVTVGNGATSGSYDYSDAVLKLSPSLALQDYFAPSTWQQDNQNDWDLGSMGPALVPGGYVFASGKSGTAYLLDQSNLGHIGGQLYMASMCRSFGGTALLGNRLFVPCVDGTRAVDVSNGSFSVAWRAADAGTRGPPVVGGGAVWVLGIKTRILYALDPNTGATMASVFVGSLQHFVTPTLTGGEVLVPTASGVVAFVGA